MIVEEVAAWSEFGVTLTASTTTDQDGGRWDDWRIVCVTTDDEPRFTRWETFDRDQFDAARERYDELVSQLADTKVDGSASTDELPEPDWSLRNLATVAFLERLVHANRVDATDGVLDQVYHEDLVYEIHRRGVHGHSGGRDAAIEGHFSWSEVGLNPVAGPIAIRGDRLALLGMLFVSNDHDDELGFWLVVEADDDERITYLGV